MGSKSERLPAIDPLPGCFWIEITSYCNFRCTFCAYPYMTRKKQYMDFDLFRNVVDMLMDSGLAVNNPLAGLHLLGEPLLHPEIDRFIDYMNMKGLATDLVTNGLLLTPAVIDRLATRNVARITVSIQSPGPESYRESRGNTSKGWDEYLEGIRQSVVRYLEITRGQPVGGIMRMDVLYMTTFNYNPNMKGLGAWKEVRGLLDQWGALAAGVCPEFSLVSDTGYEADGIRKFQICRLNDRVFNLSIREAGTWAGSLEAHRHIEPVTTGSCSVPSSQLIVLANGDVTVCCEDYDGRLTIGNVRDDHLARIWTGEKARRIRDGFSRNVVVNEFCRHCLACRSTGAVAAAGESFFPEERWGHDGPVFQWMGKKGSLIVCRRRGEIRIDFQALTAYSCSPEDPQPLWVNTETENTLQFFLTRPFHWHSFSFDIPANDDRQYLIISFETDRVFVPSATGQSADSRQLGAAVAVLPTTRPNGAV